ncbi:MAG: HNH endonuclease signature motif containing protein, partial [Nanoarchaeota archaeon]
SKGRPSPKKGETKETNESIRRASEKMKGKTYEERFGVDVAKEMKEKTGSYNRGKSYEELYGIERAKELKKLRSEHMRGRIVTKEQREKIGKKNKGKPGWSKGKTVNEDSRILAGPRNGMYGKIHTVTTRNYISTKNRGRFASEKNPNWQGGITTINQKIRNSYNFDQWRNSVFQRDNWICQECLKNGGELHPHHIKKFSKYPLLRFDTNNGITLCELCHDKITGKEEQFVTYFQDKLKIQNLNFPFYINQKRLEVI